MYVIKNCGGVVTLQGLILRESSDAAAALNDQQTSRDIQRTMWRVGHREC
jgi:hypothetical protein